MTLPDERYRAVGMARNFLRDLLDPSVTPRVPRDVRGRARAALKHYPDDHNLIEPHFDSKPWWRNSAAGSSATEDETQP